MLKDRAFFFGSYEGYRLDAGVNFVEARAERRGVGARGAGDRARCVRASRAPSAVLLPGASANPDFDIYQLQSLEKVDGELLQRPPRLPDEHNVERLLPLVP